MSKPSSISAGIVTPTPKAIDSPAEPVVCTMLFSRIVAGRNPNTREKARNSVIDSTATGIDAETVMPTFSTRYKRRRAEDDAQQRPHDDGRPGEFRHAGFVGDVGLMAAAGEAGRRRACV